MIRMRSVTLLLLVITLPVCAGDEGLELQRAHQRVFRSAIERAARYTVQIETVGGAVPRGVISDLDFAPTPDNPVEDGMPDMDEEDGMPQEADEPSPFQDTLGSDFVVADGPTTGIIYSADGYIITSSFNFVRNPTHITVRLSDDRRYVADLIASDKVRKLALLRIEADGLEPAEWVQPDDIQIGQWAVALGRGFGGSQPSVTIGVVSAKERMMGNAVQTDAKLSPANYGGPLVDVEGRVLGICVPMAQRPGELAGVEFYDAGIGFALPRNRVDAITDELRLGESIYRGWLGIRFSRRPVDGLLIVGVANPSPMYTLGIRPGDKIISANGNELNSAQHLVQSLYMVPAGQPVHVVVRKGEFEFGFEPLLARAVDLGQLETVPEPDPWKPFPINPGNRWPK